MDISYKVCVKIVNKYGGLVFLRIEYVLSTEINAPVNMFITHG